MKLFRQYVLTYIACIARMRAIATDGVAWSVHVSVCVFVTTVSATKKAKGIEMPFGI